MDNRFTFTYADIKNLATTKAKKITVIDLINDMPYQEEKKKVEQSNDEFNNIVDTLQKLNGNLSKDEAKAMASKLGYKYIDIAEFEKGYIEQLQADADADAKEKAYAEARDAYDEFMKVMGFNNNQQPTQSVINLNAVIPAAQVEPEELDESKMSFNERCELVEEMLSGNSGNSQFKKHLSVRHKNVGAKSLIKEWYKLGYISLAEKNSLLFLANISACSGHLNVTARR